MNVLMLYPKFSAGWLRYGEEARRKVVGRPGLPPLGLVTLASYLPDDFRLRLIDRNLDEVREADWAWADLVFVSWMFGIQEDDYAACRDAARRHGKGLAVGGAHCVDVPERLEREADWVCIGEGEPVIDAMVADIRAGRRGRRYGPERFDLSRSRVPRFELLRKPNRYAMHALQFSRGCPFRCEFCDIPDNFGRVPRTKDPRQMLDELSALRASGYLGMIFWVDDNFIGHPNAARAMLGEVASWNERNGHPFFYYTQATLNLADHPDLLEAMSTAGFQFVFFGIESAEAEQLAITKKSQNLRRDPLERLARIRAAGIHPFAGFIVGFDGETEGIFRAQRDFIQRTGIGHVTMSLLDARPNTPLRRRLVSEGRLVDGHPTAVPPINFIPKGELTKRQLLEGYAWLMKEIYDPDNFFPRITEAICHTRRRPALQAALQRWYGIPIFLRLVLRLGLLAPTGKRAFWRALVTIMRRNPVAVDNFVVDSIAYYDAHLGAQTIEEVVREHLASPRPTDVLDEVVPPGWVGAWPSASSTAASVG